MHGDGMTEVFDAWLEILGVEMVRSVSPLVEVIAGYTVKQPQQMNLPFRLGAWMTNRVLPGSEPLLDVALVGGYAVPCDHACKVSRGEGATAESKDEYPVATLVVARDKLPSRASLNEDTLA
jgi:hypothetical protein